MKTKFLDKLERRYGSLAIPNVAAYIVIGQVAIWLLSRLNQGLDGSYPIIELMLFDSSLVLKGEVWRIFTFPLIPPFSDPIFLIFAWYIFYMVAGALEGQWGAFRLNLYMLLGAGLGMASSFLMPGVPITNSIWGETLFLAFAYLFPNFELRLFFVLPVKVKWLGWLAWALIFYMFLNNPWQGQIFILASVSNFFFFFGNDIVRTLRSKQRVSSLKADKAKMEVEPFHVCSQCGATDKSHPERQFRYRSDECLCEVCLDAEKAEKAVK